MASPFCFHMAYTSILTCAHDVRGEAQGLARDKVFGLCTLHVVIVANAREEQFNGRFIGLMVSLLLGHDEAGRPGGSMK